LSEIFVIFSGLILILTSISPNHSQVNVFKKTRTLRDNFEIQITARSPQGVGLRGRQGGGYGSSSSINGSQLPQTT